MDLEANTGKNDSSSVWGGVLNTAVDIGKNYANQQLGGDSKPSAPQTVTQAPAAPVSSSNWKTYLPWIGGGVALLLLLVFVLKRK